jgi:hypothetical protein
MSYRMADPTRKAASQYECALTKIAMAIFYIAMKRMDAVARVAREPMAKNAELGVEGAVSEGTESPVGSAGAGAESESAGVTRVASAGVVSRVRTSDLQSNSQKDVVLLNAPTKIMAALPVGLSLSPRKMNASQLISPNVLSSYASTGFLVSDAGKR